MNVTGTLSKPKSQFNQWEIYIHRGDLCSCLVILPCDCNAFKIEQIIRRTLPSTICLLSELKTKAIEQERNEHLTHIPGYDDGINESKIMVIESTDMLMFGFLFEQ